MIHENHDISRYTSLVAQAIEDCPSVELSEKDWEAQLAYVTTNHRIKRSC